MPLQRLHTHATAKPNTTAATPTMQHGRPAMFVITYPHARRTTLEAPSSTLASAIAVLQSCSRVLVLTGAGISVSVGIPDFRSAGGLYEIVSRGVIGAVGPEEEVDDDAAASPTLRRSARKRRPTVRADDDSGSRITDPQEVSRVCRGAARHCMVRLACPVVCTALCLSVCVCVDVRVCFLCTCMHVSTCRCSTWTSFVRSRSCFIELRPCCSTGWRPGPSGHPAPICSSQSCSGVGASLTCGVRLCVCARRAHVS